MHQAKERTRTGRIEALLERIVGEYKEMPGLKLNLEQATRLWGLDSSECEAIFEALVSIGFLRSTGSGGFVWSGRPASISGPVVSTPDYGKGAA